MNSDGPRPYRSELRDAQREQTRDRIVAALVEQVRAENLTDFAVPKVARRAGVSTRTVYRYFPTREDLLAAVEQRLAEDAPEPAWPEGWADFPDYARRLYAYFERNRELIEAMHVTRLGTELAERSRQRRLEAGRERLDRWAPRPRREEEALPREVVVARVLMGSRTWRFLTTELGMSTEEAADLVAWAIGRLGGSPSNGAGRKEP